MNEIMDVVETYIKKWVSDAVHDEMERLKSVLLSVQTPQIQEEHSGRLLKIDEASKLTGFTKGYIYNMVSLHQIPFHRINRSLRFDRQELDD